MFGMFGRTRKRKKPLRVRIRAAAKRLRSLKKKAGYSGGRRTSRRTYRSRRKYY